MQIPIWISNRHIHLSEEHAKLLFGEDYTFTKFKDLSQPGQFALEETVSIKWIDNSNKNNKIDKIRILGPRRSQTQVEVMASDQYTLWIQIPTKLSWDLNNTPWITIIWPKANIALKQWVIIAQRHLHISPTQAKELWLIHKQKISIKTPWNKALSFHNVIVRVGENFDLDFHIDFDEANAGNIKKGDTGKIIEQEQ